MSREEALIRGPLPALRQGGKMNRGLIVVETGVAIMKHQAITGLFTWTFFYVTM